MHSLFSRASLKRSDRTRIRKNATSADTDIVCPPRKTRPPPLQIIPELLENEFDIDVYSIRTPATARPTQSLPQQSELRTSRITLSAYAFSIDDALLMFASESPRSPALSASSSTSDDASSDDVPTTPWTSDIQAEYNFIPPTSRLLPPRVSIRPLCITKTRSLICQEDEDIHNYFEKEGEKTVTRTVTEEHPEPPTEAKVSTEVVEEAEHDFYIHEFEDFISLSPVVPFPASPARRDSLILTGAVLPTVTDVPGPKTRGRSRHSKPLPLLPPATPPFSLPPIPTLPMMQITAQESVVRRKRNFPSPPGYTPSLPPSEPRPLPQMAVSLDTGGCMFPEDSFDFIPSCRPTAIKVAYDSDEDASIYSRSSFAYAVSASAGTLPPAIPETPPFGMYGEATRPRSSTDSDAPRSSVDSGSSVSSDSPISPFFFPSSPSSEGPEFESMQRLRSRWSSSTLASLAVEPPRTTTLLSPLKSVFGSRSRRGLLPPQKVAPEVSPRLKPSKNKMASSSSPNTLSKHIRRQGSRSSASSGGGTSSSDSDSPDGSPSGLKRKPIPVSMFLRVT